MLTIRLQRVGRRNQAAFRIVLAEKHRHVKKKAVEILGHYNPRTKEFGIKDEEKLKYWIGQHVEVSPTVHNLFIEKGLVTGDKVKSWRPKIKQAAEAVASPDAKEDSKEVKAEGTVEEKTEESKAEKEVKAEATAEGKAPQDAGEKPEAKAEAKEQPKTEAKTEEEKVVEKDPKQEKSE